MTAVVLSVMIFVFGALLFCIADELGKIRKLKEIELRSKGLLSEVEENPDASNDSNRKS